MRRNSLMTVRDINREVLELVRINRGKAKMLIQ
jgi:hypothetical protein